jgi:hypothetical protein
MVMRFARWRRALESRRAAWLAVALGVVLTAPSLLGGLQTEDWVFRALSRSASFSLWHPNLWGAPGRPPAVVLAEQLNEEKKLGFLPWVASPDFRVSFWRPLSSLTHHLDYHAWANHPLLMHAQSLLWYALLVAAAAWLFRRMLAPGWVAGLAAILYAIDDAHGQAVGWLSNRSAIVASLFGVLAIGFHDRWRRDGFKAGALLGPLCLALGLASGEYALGAVGYLIAHAIALDPAPPRRRAIAVLPWVAVVAAWALLYAAGGYGVSGSGVYLDPVKRPGAFLATGSERAGLLLLAELAVPPADVYNHFSPDRLWLFSLGALVVLGALAAVLVPALRGDRRVRFFGLGMLLSVAPACATFPEDRLLLLTGVGGMGLVASFFSWLEREQRPGRAAGMVAGMFALVHGLLAPALLPWRTLSMRRYEARLVRARHSLYLLPINPVQHLVVLNAPDYYFATMMQLTRVAQAKPVTVRTLWIAGTLGPISIRRLSARSVLVRPASGFLSRTLDRLYRGAAHPMHAGQTFHLGRTTIRVTRTTPAGLPLGAVFTFPWRLEDPHLVWAEWHNGRYQRGVMPAVGRSVVLNAR